MKHSSIYIAIALLLAFALSAKADVEFAEGSYSDILGTAQKENKIVMIDFVTDWCKWCVETDRKVYTNPEVIAFANANQINWKIDAEKGEGPELAKKYGVKGFPTIIFTDPQGSEIDRIYGYLPPDKFLERMKDYHDGKNTYGSLKKSVGDNPESPEANYLFAEKVVNNGLEDDAKLYLEKAITLDPANVQGYTDDSKIMLAYLNEDENALASALKEYPNSNKAKDAYMTMASIYAEKNNNALADEMYQTAFTNFGENDAELRQGYGLLLLNRSYATTKMENPSDEDLEGAITVLNKSLPYLQGSVNEASVYYVMSELYLLGEDYADAEICIDKAINIYDKKSYRDQKQKIADKKK